MQASGMSVQASARAQCKLGRGLDDETRGPNALDLGRVPSRVTSAFSSCASSFLPCSASSAWQGDWGSETQALGQGGGRWFKWFAGNPVQGRGAQNFAGFRIHGIKILPPQGV